MSRAYMNQIEDLLEGDTPRQKFEYLQNLISENARLKGRLDFCKDQFAIIRDNPSEKWIDSVIKTLNTPV